MSHSKKNSIIAHIDMDCFYCQVERVHDPKLMNLPVAVVQYNPFGDLKALRPTDNRIVSSGSIIAVSYEARAQGVKRNMKGADAMKICPNLILVQVPTAHGKADLTLYREAGDRVVKLLCKRGLVLEKASIDEVYIDLTNAVTERLPPISRSIQDELGPIIDIYEKIGRLASISYLAGADLAVTTTSRSDVRNGHTDHVQGMADGFLASTSAATVISNSNSSNNDQINHVDVSKTPEDYKRILCGAAIVAELRQAIKDELGFTCSGGIAPCKLLAKIASGMNKPNKQTIVPTHQIQALLANLPIARVPGFGGKFGDELSGPPFHIKTLQDFQRIEKASFVQIYGEETYARIWDASQGVDHDEVKERSIGLSLACGKTFRSTNAILVSNSSGDGELQKWVSELATELQERIHTDTESNQRRPKLLTASLSLSDVRVPYRQLKSLAHESSRQTLKTIDGYDVSKENGDRIACESTDKNKEYNNRPQQQELKQHQEHASALTSTSRSVSRSAPLPSNTTTIASSAMTLIKKIIKDAMPPQTISMSSSSSNSSPVGKSLKKTDVNLKYEKYVTYIALTATQFEDVVDSTNGITAFFGKVDYNSSKSTVPYATDSLNDTDTIDKTNDRISHSKVLNGISPVSSPSSNCESAKSPIDGTTSTFNPSPKKSFDGKNSFKKKPFIKYQKSTRNLFSFLKTAEDNSEKQLIAFPKATNTLIDSVDNKLSKSETINDGKQEVQHDSKNKFLTANSDLNKSNGRTASCHEVTEVDDCEGSDSDDTGNVIFVESPTLRSDRLGTVSLGDKYSSRIHTNSAVVIPSTATSKPFGDYFDGVDMEVYNSLPQSIRTELEREVAATGKHYMSKIKRKPDITTFFNRRTKQNKR